jgi:hypothetical protein
MAAKKKAGRKAVRATKARKAASSKATKARRASSARVTRKAPALRAGAKKATTPARKPPGHPSPQHAEPGPAARDEVFEIFKAYDRDGSGSIDRGELARLLEALGQQPTDVELSIALDAVDANRSGKISWREFKAWWSSR